MRTTKLKSIEILPETSQPQPTSNSSILGGSLTIAVLIFAAIVGVWLIDAVVRICDPNKILIISGRPSRREDGQVVGYKVVYGGWSWHIPMKETVTTMDLTTIPASIEVTNAYAKGGTPLNIQAIANVKISRDWSLVGNAIERFLDRDRQEIACLSKQILEEHLHEVVANLSPEQVNEERLQLAKRIANEVSPKLAKFGLQLDTFQIQSVSDEVDYLNAIGRQKIANIVCDAENAESKAFSTQADGKTGIPFTNVRSASHYVKTIRYGLEYSDMQLLSEAYDLLKNGAGLSHQQRHEVFQEWYQTEESKWGQTEEFHSLLTNITIDILTELDPETQEPLVEKFLDTAGQKGTGLWIVVNALELGIPIPTIAAAVNTRITSSFKGERVNVTKELSDATDKYEGDVKEFTNKVRDALYCSKICSYAQGMALLGAASKEFDYNLDLSETARIWKGGCIIRAGFLDKIKRAYQENPELPNLLLAPEFKETILQRQQAWRDVLATANKLGIPVPAFSASLDYFDSCRRARLAQNGT
jgi:6-phosphogluconate dehydrogenase (decarboxylating)